MVKFHNLPTLSGNVSFSASLHTVFGRAYRVIEIEDNVAKFVKLVTRILAGEHRPLARRVAEQDPQRRRPPGLLRAVGVSRSFEGVQALAEVDLELARSEVVGLIGPNGAGKTTLVNVITGFDFPTTGRVELEDRDVTRWSPQRLGRAGLARTFQHGHAFRGTDGARERRGRGARRRRFLARRAPARAAPARRARPAAPCGRERRPRCRTATSASSASRARSRPSRASS